MLGCRNAAWGRGERPGRPAGRSAARHPTTEGWEGQDTRKPGRVQGACAPRGTAGATGRREAGEPVRARHPTTEGREGQDTRKPGRGQGACAPRGTAGATGRREAGGPVGARAPHGAGGGSVAACARRAIIHTRLAARASAAGHSPGRQGGAQTTGRNRNRRSPRSRGRSPAGQTAPTAAGRTRACRTATAGRPAGSRLSRPAGSV